MPYFDEHVEWVKIQTAIFNSTPHHKRLWYEVGLNVTRENMETKIHSQYLILHDQFELNRFCIPLKSGSQ